MAFAERRAEAWIDALRALGVPAARCRPFSELLGDPALARAGLWWDFEHPEWGTVRQTGAVIRWDRMSMRLPRRAPLIGEHSVEALRAFGVPGERIEALVAAGVVTQRTV